MAQFDAESDPLAAIRSAAESRFPPAASDFRRIKQRIAFTVIKPIKELL